MVKGLRFDIEPPSHGWATIRLTAPDVQLEFAASSTPRDSLGDLAHAAAGLLAGLPEQIVAWNTEPVEYEFRFATRCGRTRLEVHRYPDSRRRWRGVEVPVAVVEDAPLVIVRAIWRGLRRLQGATTTETFAAAWGHPFPSSTVEQIGKELHGETAQKGTVEEEP